MSLTEETEFLFFFNSLFFGIAKLSVSSVDGSDDETRPEDAGESPAGGRQGGPAAEDVTAAADGAKNPGTAQGQMISEN